MAARDQLNSADLKGVEQREEALARNREGALHALGDEEVGQV
jgi:hypothetical protein